MNIRPITKADIPNIVRTMVDSFLQEDLYVYFIHDEQRRMAFLEKFMLFRLKFGMKYGTVLITDDCRGAAVFLPPERQMKPLDLLLLGGAGALMKCRAEERKRIMDFNTYADQAQNACIAVPHWHLSPICVSRDHQGRGYGSALLMYGLTHVVGRTAPCFLETQSAGNEKFYAKHGFETLTTSIIPNSAIPHITMVRQQEN